MKLLSTLTLPMYKFISLFSVCVILLGISACSNEIDTNADAKEIMVIYGLLNPNDSVNHIRVQKAFLTQGQSALEVAKNSDNIFFDSLEVTIDEFDVGSSNPVFRNSYTLFKNTAIAKEPGIFSNEKNIVYTLNQQINENYMYRITVTNKLTGNVATAETRLVQDPKFVLPSDVTSLYLIDPKRLIPFNWNAGLNAKIYDITMRFYWDEYDSATNQILESNKFIDWNVIQRKQVSSSGALRNNIPGINFFNFLASQLPYQVGKFRTPTKIDFIYWSADENFFLYQTVNTPSIGIVQTKPEFTNISGGNFGLFASRNQKVIDNVSISDNTIEFLRTNSATSRLKFRKP